MKLPLIASRPLVYGTRRLKAGDTFEATRSDARVLVILKKATFARPVGNLAPPSPEIARKISKATSAAPAGVADLKALRAEYQSLVGKRPAPRWDVATLKAKIAAARG